MAAGFRTLRHRAYPVIAKRNIRMQQRQKRPSVIEATE